MTSEIQKNNKQGICRWNQRRGHCPEEGKDGDGAEREVESPRAAVEAKKIVKEEDEARGGGLGDPCKIPQEVSSNLIQVLEPPKHPPGHFRLGSNHTIYGLTPG